MTAESEVTGEMLLERMAAMIPDLRARGEEAEQLGRLPDATMRDAEESGLFRAFVPKRHDGYELDFHYPPQATRLLAQGCPSSAWVLSFFTHHNWQLAPYPEEVQKTIWKDQPFALAPGQIVPNGKATPADGGYRLSRRWPWASGVMHANWAMLNGVVPGDGPAPDMRYFLVPIEDASIDVDWHVSGLKGTGSNTIAVDNIFVPENRQISFPSMLDRSAPGFATQDSYLWRVPMIMVMYYNSLTAVALGAAEGVHDLFIEDMRHKELTFGGGPAIDSAGVQMRIGRTRMELDAIACLFETTVMNIEQRARAGDEFSDAERLAMTMYSTHIIHSARRIIDELAMAAGATANYLSHPIQRFRRDLNALATHAAYNFDRNTEVYGKALFGLEIPAQQIR